MRAWLLVACLLCAANGVDIGDRIERTFLLFHDLPLTTKDAASGGWESQWDSCDPNLGFAYTGKGGFSVGNPIVMYYTAAGQVAGVGIVHFGAPLASQTRFWQPLNDSTNDNITYIMNVHFRAPAVVCSKQAQSEVIGTQVVINQGALNFNVPLRDDDAVLAKWTAGNCISGMGTHWAYDLISAPKLSYKAEQTVPLFPMYFNGTISAFLVDTATFQDIEPVGVWEGPFLPSLFCKNLCKACDWDSKLTSTLHFLLTDHSTLSCTDPCNPLIPTDF